MTIHVQRREPILPFGLIHGNASQGFAIYTTVDEMGRRGELVAVTRDEDRAQSLASRAGWYGGNGDIVEGTIFDGPEGLIFIEKAIKVPALDTNLPEARRRQIEAAKAKLTPEERALLGIKEG